MKTYPLFSPPAHAGIYALKHRETGQIYVGRSVNLRRRFIEWKGVFVNGGVGAKNHEIMAVARATGAENWDFLVVAELPGATEEELANHEDIAIKRVRTGRPDGVLNKIMERPKYSRHNNGTSLPKSTVRAEDGSAMSYAEVAVALDANITTLRKKLQKYRERGMPEVPFKLLKDRVENMGRPRASVTLK